MHLGSETIVSSFVNGVCGKINFPIIKRKSLNDIVVHFLLGKSGVFMPCSLILSEFCTGYALIPFSECIEAGMSN